MTDAQREYLLPHFAMLIVGKPGSGKTSLIKAMMTNENYYYRRFDHVMIISPSANKMGVPVRKDNMAH